jgi:hypothetical protein
LSAQTPPPAALTAAADKPPDPASARPAAVDTLVGLYTEPGETFRALASWPSFVVPVVGAVLLNVIFTFVWLHKADRVELSRRQMQEAGVFDRIPAEQHEAVVQRQARMLPFFAWVGAILFGPIGLVVLSALFLFVYRFFYAASTTFAQSVTVVAWTFFAVALVTTPVIMLILALKGDWSVDPRNVVQANLGSVVNKAAVPKPVHALLDSLDLFSAWTLFLLSAGYAATARRSVGAAAVGVVALSAL